MTLRLMHPQFVVQSCQKPLLTKRYCQRDVEFMVMGVIFNRIFFCLTLFYFLGRLVFPSMDIVFLDYPFLQKKLDQALAAPVESLLEAGGKGTWASIRRLLKRETEAAISGFSSAVTSFELDQSTFDKMVQNLRDYARSIVEKKSREEAGKVLILMKDRYVLLYIFNVSFQMLISCFCCLLLPECM